MEDSRHHVISMTVKSFLRFPFLEEKYNQHNKGTTDVKKVCKRRTERQQLESN